jgi:hypothetical protein
MNYIILKFIGFVLITVIAHWFLVNVYVTFCAPMSVFGIFKTMLNLGSPVCQFINLIQFELAKNYMTLWITAGVVTTSYVISKLK